MKTTITDVLATATTKTQLITAGFTKNDVAVLIEGNKQETYETTLKRVCNRLQLEDEFVMEICGKVYDYETYPTPVELVPAAKPQPTEPETPFVKLTKYFKKRTTVELTGGLAVKETAANGRVINLITFNDVRVNRQGVFVGHLVFNAYKSIPAMQGFNPVLVKGMPSFRNVTVDQALEIFKALDIK
jgi:hypothetical protein